MNAPVTRRTLLGATAAVGAMVLPTVAEAGAPAPDFDSELSVLLDRFDEARAIWDATEAPLTEAMDRLVAAIPPRPDALWHRARDLGHDLGGTSGREMRSDGRWVAFYTDTDVARLRVAPPILRWATVGDDIDPPPKETDLKGEARRQQIIAVHNAWTAACRRAEDEVGFTAASEAEAAAADAWSAADDAVKHHQPRTLAGLARKAAWVADRLAAGNCDEDLGEVFAREVAAFGVMS